jgi:integrase
MRERVSKQGETTYAVLFRLDGKQTSETFLEPKTAEDFRALVDLIGARDALARLNGHDASEALTVDDLAERYFEWKQPDLTPRSLGDYRRDYDNWIRPWFGHRLAAHIDERDVQKWVDHMKRTLDPKTVRGHHILLGAIYRYAAARSRRLVQQNPCAETQLPKVKRKPPKGFTMREWQDFYAANSGTHPDAADLALFLVLTGWRWSEAAALPVGAVEDYGDQMYVTVTQVNRRDAALKFVLVADAKTYESVRRIEVTPATARLIRRRIAGKAATDLVFTNAEGRRWYQQNFLNRTWTAMLKAAGLPHQGDGRKTPHALRHTHVAMLDRAGATLPQMSRRAGHSNIQTTVNVYGGMIDNIGTQVLTNLDAMALPTDAAGAIVSGEVVRELD